MQMEIENCGLFSGAQPEDHMMRFSIRFNVDFMHLFGLGFHSIDSIWFRIIIKIYSNKTIRKMQIRLTPVIYRFTRAFDSCN